MAHTTALPAELLARISNDVDIQAAGFSTMKIVLLASSLRLLDTIAQHNNTAERITTLVIGTESLDQWESEVWKLWESGGIHYRRLTALQIEEAAYQKAQLHRTLFISVIAKLPNLHKIVIEDPPYSEDGGAVEGWKPFLGADELENTIGVNLAWNGPYPSLSEFSRAKLYAQYYRQFVTSVIFPPLIELAASRPDVEVELLARGAYHHYADSLVDIDFHEPFAAVPPYDNDPESWTEHQKIWVFLVKHLRKLEISGINDWIWPVRMLYLASHSDARVHSITMNTVCLRDKSEPGTLARHPELNFKIASLSRLELSNIILTKDQMLQFLASNWTSLESVALARIELSLPEDWCSVFNDILAMAEKQRLRYLRLESIRSRFSQAGQRAGISSVEMTGKDGVCRELAKLAKHIEGSNVYGDWAVQIGTLDFSLVDGLS